MTSSTFCTKCGAPLEAAQAFCHRCGASIAEQDAAAAVIAPAAAAQPVAAVPNNFCHRCGAQLEAGTRFCSRCGAPVQDDAAVMTQDVRHAQMAFAQSPETPAPPAKKNWLPYIGGGIAAIFALLVIIGTFTGEDDDDRTSSASTGASSSPVSSSTALPSGTSSATGTPRPAGTTAPRGATLATRVDNGFPAPKGAATLIDSTRNNTKAATAIANGLKAAGMNTTGMGVYVFPLQGVSNGASILVIDADSTAPAFANASSSASFDQKKLAQAIVSSAPKEANVQRLAFNVRGKDKEGNFVLTLTMTTATLERIAKGTISDAELKTAAQIGVERK